MNRREVLAGALAVPVAMSFPPFGSAGEGRPIGLLLYDGTDRRARATARRAGLLGIATRDTGGEVAALLRRERLFAVGRTVVGVTGHSEMLLAADMARSTGRRLVTLAQLGRTDRWLADGAGARWQPLLRPILARPADGPLPTAFAWVAADPARA